MIKPIPWYKFYSISDDWIVYYKGIEKEQNTTSKKYKRVYIKWKHILINRLVALIYLWDIEWKVVMHLDDNPSNNCVSNLRIGSQKDNIQDMINKWRNKLYGKFTWITPNEKKEILSLWLSTKEIVEKYWIHRNTILSWKKNLWLNTNKKYNIEYIKKVINTPLNNKATWRLFWISNVTVLRRRRKFL